ncbi:MAG: 50S ribosomal protein L3 [Candidatus Aenigmatarchaeota archaeon]
MPEPSRPKKGSTGMWPRKRASRMYPSVNSCVDTDECKPLLFAGYKAGMTQVTMKDLRKTSPTKNQIISAPVTVLDIPPLLVIGARSYKDTVEGLTVVEDVGAEEEDIPKKVRERVHIPERDSFEKEGDLIRFIVSMQPQRSGLGKKEPEVFEVPIGGSFEEQEEYAEEKLGEELKVEDVFEEGEFLDAIAITKGKGYEGPVTRHGAKIDRRKDEAPRRIGSMGARGQGRVLHTTPQPGQHGLHRRTDECKHFLGSFDPEEINPEDGFGNYGLVKENSLLIKGSVPGPKKRLVMLRKSIKDQSKLPVEIKDINTSSQQGV